MLTVARIQTSLPLTLEMQVFPVSPLKVTMFFWDVSTLHQFIIVADKTSVHSLEPICQNAFKAGD